MYLLRIGKGILVIPWVGLFVVPVAISLMAAALYFFSTHPKLPSYAWWFVVPIWTMLAAAFVSVLEEELRGGFVFVDLERHVLTKKDLIFPSMARTIPFSDVLDVHTFTKPEPGEGEDVYSFSLELKTGELVSVQANYSLMYKSMLRFRELLKTEIARAAKP